MFKRKSSKKSPLQKLDAKLWKIFSVYVRLRDTRPNGYGRCCSCPKIIFWKGNDAGHFINRGKKSTKFHEKNSHLQCVQCNRFEEGNAVGYTLFMIETYGKQFVELLYAESRKMKKIDRFDYEVMIKHYTEEVRKLKLTKNPEIFE